MKCTFCNNEIPLNVTSCPSCGAPVQQMFQQPQQMVQQQQQMNQQYQQTMNTVGQTPQMNMAYNAMYLMAKSRTVYVLLAIFLGEFGIHNFYAGYSGKGTLQLLITVFTAGYAGILSWLWAICNALTIKNDARGIPFK